MQFKNIGDLINLVNTNSSIFEFQNWAKSVGDIDKVAEALNRTKDISDNLKIRGKY